MENETAGFFSGFSQVEAVALGGSAAADRSDASSDRDFYVYLHSEIPPDARLKWIAQRASRFEVNNRFWETGDEWIEKASGVTVDVMYRDPRWIKEQLERVLVRHEASIGYSTCFWANVCDSRILFDRNGWFAALKASADRPYPEELRRNIVQKNYPILRNHISSYARQIEKSIDRNDVVSLNHRIAAFLASYFDVLFAWNRIPHPGEKRLVTLATRHCTRLPPDLETGVAELIRATADLNSVSEKLSQLMDGLDAILATDRD